METNRYEILDEESILDRINELLGGIPKEEVVNWKSHSLTKALLWMLTYSEMRYHNEWVNGSFTTESAYGTAQANAKALGALEHIKLMKQYILEEIE